MIQQTFSICNDEVARGKFFSHVNEPTLTINPAKRVVYINAAGLKRLPDMEYAFILISKTDNRISIFPCDSGERDAIRLRAGGINRNKPRHIHCSKEFWNAFLHLTGWKRDSRYRLIGYVARGESDTIISFALSSAEVFSAGDLIPANKENISGSFGEPFEEHRSSPIIKRAEGDIEIPLVMEDEPAYEN